MFNLIRSRNCAENGGRSAGRMISVKSATSTYYTVPQSADPTTWGYSPTGAMNRGTYGNGVIETTGYNNRLQVSSICDSRINPTTCDAASGALFGKNYGYYDSAGHNNGDILSIADTLSATRNQTYSYDSLNRVISGAQADNAFNVVHHYDPWGNMTESGTSNFQPLFDGNNRMAPSGGCTPNLSPYCVDAAGDLLKDNQGHVYTYDVEARIKTVDGSVSSYTYGPDGNRVRKDANGAATEYIYFAGNVIAEKNVTIGAWTDYIFAYGKRIAKDTSPNGSAAQYYQDDHLGTTRIMTDAAGNKIMDCTFNAFGEQIACTPDNASNHYRYTGKERDTESGLDDFGARYYSSTIGRWTTPDWSERPIAIPYALFGDPQSLNLYLYVRNDPVSKADADGHILNEAWGIFTGAPNTAEAAQKAVDIPPGTMGAPQTDPNQKFTTDQSGQIICTGNCSSAAAIKDGADAASKDAEVTVTGSAGPVTVNSKGDVNAQVVPSLGVSVDVTVPKPNPENGPTTTVGAATPGALPVQLSGGVNIQNGSVSGVTVSVVGGYPIKSLDKINPGGLNVSTDKEGLKSLGKTLKDIFVKAAATVGFIGPI